MNKTKKDILKKLFNTVVKYSLHRDYNIIVKEYNTKNGTYTINTTGTVFYQSQRRFYQTTISNIGYIFVKKFYEDVTERLWEYENY